MFFGNKQIQRLSFLGVAAIAAMAVQATASAQLVNLEDGILSIRTGSENDEVFIEADYTTGFIYVDSADKLYEIADVAKVSVIRPMFLLATERMKSRFSTRTSTATC